MVRGNQNQPINKMQNTTPEALDAMIIENLKAANAAEKLGEKEEAKYYREHASKLTVMKFGL